MSRRLRLCAVAIAVGLMPAAVSLSAPVAAAESTSGAPYGAGQCNFSTDQWLAAAVALSDWVDSADRPGDAELTSLFAAQPGALDLDYTPAAWPAR